MGLFQYRTSEQSEGNTMYEEVESTRQHCRPERSHIVSIIGDMHGYRILYDVSHM